MTCSSLPSRRAVIGGAMTIAMLPGRAHGAAPDGLVAGTYAHEGGAGLVPLAPGDGGWTAGPAIGAIRNASFGVTAPRHGLRYLVDERTDGAIGVYDGMFRRLAAHPTGGADPCHAALSPDQSLLAVANYSSGDVALWRLDRTGGLPIAPARMVRHEGRGPDAQRQAGPHAHWVGFTADGDILHSVDLGADAIFAHRVNRATGSIDATTVAYRAAAGSGPRHLARHPRLPVAFLVAELANTVTMLHARRDGGFVAFGMVSTLPAGFRGSSAAAHIALDQAGTRLYVSNRGHDSIAVFAIEADGALRLIQHVGCGGHWPRLFLIREDRREMLVANERSGTVATLAIGSDGRLWASDRTIAVPGVAFLGS